MRDENERVEMEKHGRLGDTVGLEGRRGLEVGWVKHF